MKFKPAYLLAASISVLILLWFLYGSLIRPDKAASTAPENAANTSAAHGQPNAANRPQVKIETIQAVDHPLFLTLSGRTEAEREVSIKAETAGIVIKAPVREGRAIAKNTLICQQDIDARQAMLDQVQAQYRARALELEATKTLVAKGFRSSTQALSAQAALDGAQASVTQAKIELDNVNIRAPFSGILEKYMAEVGDFLAPGQPCALLVDLDPLVITVEASEAQIGIVKRGTKAQISLATGEHLVGTVRYIEARANPATRTFRIEIETPNPKRTLKAGVSAHVKIAGGTAKSHFIPSNVLTLNDQGEIGVRIVDLDGVVRFQRTQTQEETVDGVWVTGLGEQTDLIVLGQDYVRAGIQVDTQYTGSTSGTPQGSSTPQGTGGQQ